MTADEQNKQLAEQVYRRRIKRLTAEIGYLQAQSARARNHSYNKDTWENAELLALVNLNNVKVEELTGELDIQLDLLKKL